jgi:hypothetical protein
MGLPVIEEVDAGAQRVLITRLTSAPPEHLSSEAVAKIRSWVEPTPKDVRAVMSIEGASPQARRLLREVLSIAEQIENRKQ